MADSSCGKKSTKCPHCSSASQKNALCICSCKTKLSPMSVVEMSQTSSTGSSEFIVSPEKRKEKGASKDVTSGKEPDQKGKGRLMVKTLTSKWWGP